MGYTHYWRMKEKLKVTKIQMTLLSEILSDYKSILFGSDGTGKPILNTKEICFNGDASKELDHETFFVKFGSEKDFEFCKTARKPYDTAVCKCLLVLALSPGFDISSDGVDQIDDKRVLNDENWLEAQTWFIQKGYADTIAKKIIPYLNSED